MKEKLKKWRKKRNIVEAKLKAQAKLERAVQYILKM